MSILSADEVRVQGNKIKEAVDNEWSYFQDDTDSRVYWMYDSNPELEDMESPNESDPAWTKLGEIDDLTALIAEQAKRIEELESNRKRDFKGMITEINANSVLGVKTEADKAWNDAKQSDIRIISNYRDGTGLFQQ